jgi:hypothetical protein
MSINTPRLNKPVIFIWLIIPKATTTQY